MHYIARYRRPVRDPSLPFRLYALKHLIYIIISEMLGHLDNGHLERVAKGRVSRGMRTNTVRIKAISAAGIAVDSRIRCR
jgi:hypothetical protein